MDAFLKPGQTPPGTARSDHKASAVPASPLVRLPELVAAYADVCIKAATVAHRRSSGEPGSVAMALSGLSLGLSGVALFVQPRWLLAIPQIRPICG